MCIGFDGHNPQRIGFLPRSLVDFAAHLVSLLSVQAPRFACPFRLELAQALKQQHTAGVFLAHPHDAVGHLVGGIGIHAAHMLPQLPHLLIAVLTFDRLARLPLLFGDAPQMAIALLIEAMIADKDPFDNLLVLSGRITKPLLEVAPP